MLLQDLSRKGNILESRIEFVQAKGERQASHPKNNVLSVPQKTSVQLDWEKIKTIGTGLVNMGNTCFLNSVLQCLSYIPALAQAVIKSRHECASKSTCTLFAMEEHLKIMDNAKGSIVPKPILSKLRFISKSMKLGRQEDAHEFLLGLLESMQKNCMGRKLDSSSHVKTIFNGSILSTVKCRVCSFESKKVDPILDIALDIKNCPNLKTAFSIYTKKELLSGGNRYFCERYVDKI